MKMYGSTINSTRALFPTLRKEIPKGIPSHTIHIITLQDVEYFNPNVNEKLLREHLLPSKSCGKRDIFSSKAIHVTLTFLKSTKRKIFTYFVGRWGKSFLFTAKSSLNLTSVDYNVAIMGMSVDSIFEFSHFFFVRENNKLSHGFSFNVNIIKFSVVFYSFVLFRFCFDCFSFVLNFLLAIDSFFVKMGKLIGIFGTNSTGVATIVQGHRSV